LKDEIEELKLQKEKAKMEQGELITSQTQRVRDILTYERIFY